MWLFLRQRFRRGLLGCRVLNIDAVAMVFLSGKEQCLGLLGRQVFLKLKPFGSEFLFGGSTLLVLQLRGFPSPAFRFPFGQVSGGDGSAVVIGIV